MTDTEYQDLMADLHTLARAVRKMANGHLPSNGEVKTVTMVEERLELELRGAMPDPAQLRAALDFRGRHEPAVNGHALAGGA